MLRHTLPACNALSITSGKALPDHGQSSFFSFFPSSIFPSETPGESAVTNLCVFNFSKNERKAPEDHAQALFSFLYNFVFSLLLQQRAESSTRPRASPLFVCQHPHERAPPLFLSSNERKALQDHAQALFLPPGGADGDEGRGEGGGGEGGGGQLVSVGAGGGREGTAQVCSFCIGFYFGNYPKP